MLSPCLAFLLNAEGFQQEIVTMTGSYLRRDEVRKICIPLAQPMRMHTLTLLADAAMQGQLFSDVCDAWEWGR